MAQILLLGTLLWLLCAFCDLNLNWSPPLGDDLALIIPRTVTSLLEIPSFLPCVSLSVCPSAFPHLTLGDCESLSVLEVVTLCYVMHFFLFVFSFPPPRAGSPASFSLFFHDTNAVDISTKFSNLFIRKQGKNYML